MKTLLKKIPLLVTINQILVKTILLFIRRKKYFAFYKNYQYYKKNKVSPTDANQQVINLFTETDGAFNNTVANILSFFGSKHKLNSQKGLLGKELNSQLVEQLKQDGYYIFNTKLPDDKLQKLKEFATTSPANPLLNIDGKFQFSTPVVYDANKLISTAYHFPMQDIMENETVQELCTDESILWLMQQYLGTSPVFDLLAMWWSTPHKHEAEAVAAQLYHFDMDRIKFIKIFFYLKDVTPDNGPHCFVKGSHLRKPQELLSRGYARIPDKDIEKYYPKEDILEICGKAGTILMVDTSGFHKGKPLVSGERLLLQFEFAVSMYGVNYPKLKLTDKIGKPFRESMKKYGNTYKEIFESTSI